MIEENQSPMKGYIFTPKDTDPTAVMDVGVHGTWQPPLSSSTTWTSGGGPRRR